MSVVKTLSFEAPKVQKEYPYFLIDNANESTPLIVSLLQEGELPLVCKYNGVAKEVGRISPSALNVDKLIRTHGSILVYKSEFEYKALRNVEEYLEEVCEWMDL